MDALTLIDIFEEVFTPGVLKLKNDQLQCENAALRESNPFLSLKKVAEAHNIAGQIASVEQLLRILAATRNTIIEGEEKYGNKYVSNSGMA